MKSGLPQRILQLLENWKLWPHMRSLLFSYRCHEATGFHRAEKTKWYDKKCRSATIRAGITRSKENVPQSWKKKRDIFVVPGSLCCTPKQRFYSPRFLHLILAQASWSTLKQWPVNLLIQMIYSVFRAAQLDWPSITFNWSWTCSVQGRVGPSIVFQQSF